MVEDGLIDFRSKESIQNGIALCYICHTNYDSQYNPSFFFLPTDLDYFINFELKDRKRRQNHYRRTHEITMRLCPTPEQYRVYQHEHGVEGTESGGLYLRIMTRNFHGRVLGHTFEPGPSLMFGTTKSWPGSPMASLHRAMIMLQRLKLRGVPDDIRDKLLKLQVLYTKEPDFGSIEGEEEGEEGAEGAEGAEGVESEEEEEAGSEEEEEAESDEEEGVEGEEKGEEGKEQRSPQENSHSMLTKQQPNTSRPHRWHWGPSATSQDAIHFFRGVL